jgi:hypothetical protein
MYRGTTGRSVSSIRIFCFALLSIAFADKNLDGSLIEKGVPVLSLNCTMYLVNCAETFREKREANTTNAYFLFIKVR